MLKVNKSPRFSKGKKVRSLIRKISSKAKVKTSTHSQFGNKLINRKKRIQS